MALVFKRLTLNQVKQLAKNLVKELSAASRQTVPLHDSQEAVARILGFNSQHQLLQFCQDGRTPAQTAQEAIAILKTSLMSQTMISWGGEGDFDTGLITDLPRLVDVFDGAKTFSCNADALITRIENGTLELDPSQPPEVWASLAMLHLGTATLLEGLSVDPENESMFPTALALPSPLPQQK